MKVRVECYSGQKVDERPIKFWLGDAVLFVESVEDQWYGPTAAFLRVRADDGNTYVLGHDETNDEWTLESFRSERSPGQFDPHLDPPFKHSLNVGNGSVDDRIQGRSLARRLTLVQRHQRGQDVP